MKAIFILIVGIFYLNTLYAEPGDSIFVIVSGDTVHIWNTGAHENCGCLFRMDVALSNDTIYVTEVDTTSYWAYCYCNFDLCASVTGLQSGNYFVKVFRYMPLFYPDTVFYIGSTSFTYGGSPMSFTSKSFQSECYDITSVKGKKLIPLDFILEQNFPNPFNPSTTINYSIPEISFVILKVFDLLGSEIETLVNGEKPAGTYEVTWYAETLPSGIYFYQMRAGDYINTRKMVLIK